MNLPKQTKQVNLFTSLIIKFRPYILALVCLLSGYITTLGFGYTNRGIIWTLPIFGLAVLLNVISQEKIKSSCIYTFFFGMTFFGFGIGWTYNSLHVYGGISLFLSIFIAFIFGCFLALFFTLATYIAKKLAHNKNYKNQLIYLWISWSIFEYLRTFILGGFGWLNFGYSQVPKSPLAGFIPVIGNIGVTSLVLILAVIIVIAINQRTSFRSYLFVSSLLVVLLIGYLLKGIAYTTPVKEKFTASIIQASVPQDRQWMSNNVTTLPDRYYQLASNAAGKLIVAPESAFPFNWQLFTNEHKKRYLNLLDEKDATMILGTFSRHPETVRPQNTAAIFNRSQETYYSKRHLTPYGEYLPFANFLEPILDRANIPYANLQPGEGDGIVDLGFVVLGMSICYESLFPRLFNAPPAEVIINITNDSWFNTTMSEQHLQIAATRALENQRWLIRASNTGPSAFINPQGRVRKFIFPLDKKVIDFEIQPLSGMTPYTRLGNSIFIIVMLSAIVVNLIIHYKNK